MNESTILGHATVQAGRGRATAPRGRPEKTGVAPEVRRLPDRGPVHNRGNAAPCESPAVLLIPVLLAALVLAGVVFFLKRRKLDAPGRPSAAASAASAEPAEPAPTAPSAPSAPLQAAMPPPKPPELLAQLDALAWIRAEALPEARRRAVADVFRHVPRPPRLLQQLLSPEFINKAGMEELADLIGGEPLVAARVLATANSAMFGLATPVKGLRQAIAVLGLITLRILCLQYLMIRSFKADSPERQTLLTHLWNASTLASEMSQRLARRLGRPDPSRLGTLVVLSFLGRLAVSAALPRGLLATLPAGSFLQRTRNEQAALGLGTAEIGGLLMHGWDLPASLVDDVRRVDPCLVERAPDLDLALCYLCARLGERLASGDLRRLSDFDLAASDSIDFHRIQARLARPDWLALAAALREPALCEALQRVADALRDGAAAAG